MERRPRESFADQCPVEAALEVIRGRWKGTILWRLEEGPMRTSELRRSIPGVPEAVLIRHLGELVADGILDRDATDTVPPQVTYRISEYGLTLAPVVRSLCDWGAVHLEHRRAESADSAGTGTSGIRAMSAAT